MLVNSIIIEKLKAIEYPINLESFLEKYREIQGSKVEGSIWAICISINCFCRRHAIEFRLGYDKNTKQVKQITESQSRAMFD